VEALWLSVRLAVVVAATLLVLAVPLAYWLSQTKWRAKFLVESFIALPLVLPPTVLGFYLLTAMGANGLLGKLWMAWYGAGRCFASVQPSVRSSAFADGF
jgi:molybdate transport system permease protein